MKIEDIRGIRIEEFDYELPDERIAKHPLAERDKCRLLVADSEGISHRRFDELGELLTADGRKAPLMICNETRVINARLEFHKETGSRIEIFLLEPYSPADYVQSFAATRECVWTGLVGNAKKWKAGALTRRLEIDGKPVTLSATLTEGATEGGERRIRLEWSGDVSFASVLEAAGDIPIPPYLNRKAETTDSDDYQTVYSRVEGSVAAPTAGLHFTDALMDDLKRRGVEICKVTLHVGAGTFKPVKSESIGEHPMHTETVSVPLSVIERIIAAKEEGRPILAVGTTSVRTLESLPQFGRLCLEGADVSDAGAMSVSQWKAYDRSEGRVMSDEVGEGDWTLEWLRGLRDAMVEKGMTALNGATQIMIAPGYTWRVVDEMVTNFHQPESTLLLLVSSFLEPGEGRPRIWRRVYDEALREGYRFLSYGDACLFLGQRKYTR